MKAAGEVVPLTYDWRGEGPPPEEGDVLQTQTGRRYLLVGVRRVKTSKPVVRLKIEGLVLDPGERPEGEHRVFELLWNRRCR